MTTSERVITMLRATPGVVTPELMKSFGIHDAGYAIRSARAAGHRIDRVIGLGWRLVR